jgi:chromosome segregation ATPase
MEDNNNTLENSIAKLRTQNEQQAREIDSLRDRANLSQQNWVKERDDLIRREAIAREELDTANQAMQDWEVLAMDERSLRENLRDKVAELEDQLATVQESHDRLSSERDSQSQTVDGLQRALRDIQEGRPFEVQPLFRC